MRHKSDNRKYNGVIISFVDDRTSSTIYIQITQLNVCNKLKCSIRIKTL